jgi:hypothetical protein
MAKFEFGIDGTNEGAAEGFPVWEGPLPPVGITVGNSKWRSWDRSKPVPPMQGRLSSSYSANH